MGENESRCPLIRCLISSFADYELSLLLALFIIIDFGYFYVCIVSQSHVGRYSSLITVGRCFPTVYTLEL